MEQFFAPTRRLQHEEIYEGEDDNDERIPFEFAEVQLAVPVEAFLNQSGWGSSDFLTFMTASVLPKIGWISKDTFLSFNNVDSVLACDQLESGRIFMPILQQQTV
jgi:hypothetical protein